MIERLVQQQEITAPQHQQGKLQAAALTERARPDCPEDAVAAEQEEVQEIARLGFTHGAFPEYGLQDRPLQIERLLFLCHDTQTDVDSQTYHAGLRRHL